MRLMIFCLVWSLSQATTSYAEEVLGISTPSGNIQCGMFDYGPDERWTRCDIFEYSSSFREPADCEFDWGGSFVISPSPFPGEPICASDMAWGGGPTKVLPYGTSVTVGGITCSSERSGLTCVNASGHGFTLSRAKQRVF